MNSLRPPVISPFCVNGEAPAKTSMAARPLAALCTAPASDCVPHSTCTSTACASPVACQKPWAALMPTISFGQVTTSGILRPVARASAIASTSAGWSLPRLTKRYETPASTSASRNALLAVYIARSANEARDHVRAEANFLIVRLAQRDVVVHVEIAGRIAVLVEPDERRVNVKEDAHRLVIIIGDERVTLAGRLVDEIAGGRGPTVFEIAPFPRNREGHHLVGMIVPVHEPGLFRPQDVAPLVQRR